MGTDQRDSMPALGQPPGAADDDEPDIAGEHEDTAVDKDVITGDDQREPESPDGWAGMEPTD